MSSDTEMKGAKPQPGTEKTTWYKINPPVFFSAAILTLLLVLFAVLASGMPTPFFPPYKPG